LVWDFTDAGSIREDLGALRLTRLPWDRYGEKTREALQIAISYHASVGRRGAWKPLQWHDRTRFRCGGTLLLTSQLTVPLDQLENPIYGALALVPHRSRRGPNGIWLIGRGPEHSVEKLFAGCGAYYVVINGEPIYVSDQTHSRFQAATVIDLFSSEEDARERAEMERDDADDSDSVQVASGVGAELLRLIAGCDLIQVDGRAFAFSRAGELVVASIKESRISTAEELAAAVRIE
jgi:hypothetical protein